MNKEKSPIQIQAENMTEILLERLSSPEPYTHTEERDYEELFKVMTKATEMCLKLITEMQKFYIEDCFEVEQGNFTYEQLYTRYIMKDTSISKKIKQLYRDLEKLGLKVEPYERKEV